jgi:hypothetical protein
VSKYGADADEANAKDMFHPDPSRQEAIKKEFDRWQKAVFRPTQSTVSMSCASTISEASSTSGASSSASALPTSYSEGLFLPSLSETVFVHAGDGEDDGRPSFLARSVAAASF